jgi:hypothetical protein
MSPTEAEIAYRAAQHTVSGCQLGRPLLDSVLRALPSAPPDASVAWRYARIRRVIEEICAFGPLDPIEAMTAAHIVIARHVAADISHRSLDGTLATPVAARMRRTADSLLRTARQMERMLVKQRARQPQGSQAPADVQFDLAELDAIWSGIAARRPAPAVAPVGPQSDDAAATCWARAPASAPQPDKRQSAAAPAGVERTKFTLCGQRVDLVKLATMPVAGSA